MTGVGVEIFGDEVGGGNGWGGLGGHKFIVRGGVWGGIWGGV